MLKVCYLGFDLQIMNLSRKQNQEIVSIYNLAPGFCFVDFSYGSRNQNGGGIRYVMPSFYLITLVN